MKIEIVSIEEWQALYVDGEKKLEGHEISIENVLSCIKDVEFESYYFEQFYDDDYPYGNKLPSLTTIKELMLESKGD